MSERAEALSNELTEFCKSDSLSEDGLLREIIEQHGLTPNNIPNISDYKFFSFACHNERVNKGIIQYLLEYFPDAASATDNYDTVTTVEYLSQLYPAAINYAGTSGLYSIHAAIGSMSHRDNPRDAVEIIQFLLDCYPNVKLQKFRGTFSLLYFASCGEYDDSNIEAGLQIIKVIYDAHPEAIESDEITSNIQRYHQQVRTFINSQLVYSRQAKDHRLMMTPDERGQLPLHTALQNNVRLGSITLLVKGNPSAVQSPDNSGALPLHVACLYHDSASVIQYLVGLDATTLGTVDRVGNTSLHYACRDAKYEIIMLLLDKHGAVSVSKRNAQEQLPIELLWGSNEEVLDRESADYTESVFRLLRAYPDTIMNCNVNMKQQSKSDGSSTQNVKKRKFCAAA